MMRLQDYVRRLCPLLVLLTCLTAGCGYFMAGTWEDDPGNWGRAFGSTKPPDVKVVHSKYWRSPHFTYEYSYFFEIAPNAALKSQLFGQNKLKQLTGADADNAKRDAGSSAPKWFAPKDAIAYELWVPADQPEGYLVLIDRVSGEMFMFSQQL